MNKKHKKTHKKQLHMKKKQMPYTHQTHIKRNFQP